MKRNILFLCVGIVAVVGIGLAVWFANKPSVPVVPPTPSFGRTYEDLLAGVDRTKMKCIDTLPQEAVDARMKRYEGFRTDLQQAMNAAPGWRDFAAELKFFCDYEGAAIALERSVSLNPIGDIAMHNLADLYENFLNDFDRAEYWYRKAFEANPKSFFDYVGLANLYWRRFADQPDKQAQVEPIILSGVQNDPENTKDYYTFLVEYFTDQGNTPKVEEYQRLLSALQ